MNPLFKTALAAASLITITAMPLRAGGGIADDINASDAYRVEKMAMAEAEGEDETGKMYVMRVIMNRVESPDFPDTVEGVLSQDGAFASYYNGRYEAAEPDLQCLDAMEAIQTGRWDESRGATYFEAADNEDPWHRENLEFLFRHGNHVFYKG